MALPFLRGVVLIVALTALGACSLERRESVSSRAFTPIPQETLDAMDALGTNRNAPILIRAYKKESEVEIWKRTTSGQFALLKTYPVCRWSGQLGPKTREGDRQVPEGFYTVTPAQMNPNSALWLSFNVGYPNPLERSLGRTGGDIMVHGTCSSRGCYAMTNEQMEEIYAVMREAFQGGQKTVQFQSFPFRMTVENFAKFRNDPNLAFWKNLKEGSDRFDITKREMAVGYCGNRYTFGATDAPGCGETVADQDAAAVSAKMRDDDIKIAALVASGINAVKMSYADGDQNTVFRDPANKKLLEKWAASGELSRPEALATVKEQKLDHKGNVIAEAAPVVNADSKTDSANGDAPPSPAPVKSKPSFFQNLFGMSLFQSPDADNAMTTTPAPLPPPRS